YSPIVDLTTLDFTKLPPRDASSPIVEVHPKVFPHEQHRNLTLANIGLLAQNDTAGDAKDRHDAPIVMVPSQSRAHLLAQNDTTGDAKDRHDAPIVMVPSQSRAHLLAQNDTTGDAKDAPTPAPQQTTPTLPPAEFNPDPGGGKETEEEPQPPPDLFPQILPQPPEYGEEPLPRSLRLPRNGVREV